LSEYQRTVYEIAKNSNQFVIIPCLKIFPGKIVVFGFRSVGCEYIFQYIFLAREIVEVLVQPHCPVA